MRTQTIDRRALPVYRSFIADRADRAEVNRVAGPACGYSVTIEALPNRGVEHFPTLAAAKLWAKAEAKGAHYSIKRETLSEYLAIVVGATADDDGIFNSSGWCEVSTFRHIVAGAKRRATPPAWLEKLAQLA